MGESSPVFPNHQNTTTTPTPDLGHGNEGGSQRIRKRKAAPKVRTACTTCKLRRVKCDETQPSCLRCIKYWGSCAGYGSLSEKAPLYPGSKNHTQKIVPAPYPRVDTANALIVLREPYIGPAFETPEEDRLFQVFLNDTSPALSGAFDAPIWSYLLPQYSVSMPFIRHGVAALAAMTLACMEVLVERVAGNRGAEDNCLGRSQTYKKAIVLYGKSLQHMRIALLKPNYSIRDALLGCLLIVCFEGFHGHYYASIMHAQNGLQLFHTWLDRQPAIKSRVSPFPSPNRTDLEDELVAAMHQLDVQVLSFFDSRPTHTHITLANQDTQALKSMPSTFFSLSQARLFWNLIHLRTCHFIASTLSSIGSRSTALMFRGPTVPYPEVLDSPIGVKIFAQDVIVPKEYEAERAKYSADIEAWERAFAAIFKQLNVPGNSQARGATILLMNAKMMRILLAGLFFESEMEYDPLLPEFQSIYDLAVSIWHSHVIKYDVGVSYNFGLGVLPPIFLVAARCRDGKLRRQVVNLLFSAFHREHCWDSFGLAYVAQWLIKVEEEDQTSIAQPTQTTECVPGVVLKAMVPDKDSPDVEKCSVVAKRGSTTESTILETQIGASREFCPVDKSTSAESECGKKNISLRKILMAKGEPGFTGEAEFEVVPEESRVRITRFDIDLNMRTVRLEYTQGPIKGKEKVNFKEHVLKW